MLKTGNKVYVCHAFYPLGRYDVNAPYAKDPGRRGEYRSEGRMYSRSVDKFHPVKLMAVMVSVCPPGDDRK